MQSLRIKKDKNFSFNINNVKKSLKRFKTKIINKKEL